MPSYHEGLPIALLEAMSYSLPAIVSDIPANLEVNLKPKTYFPVGNINKLREQLIQHTNSSHSQVSYASYLEHYDWSKIAAQTMAVYQQAIKKRES